MAAVRQLSARGAAGALGDQGLTHRWPLLPCHVLLRTKGRCAPSASRILQGKHCAVDHAGFWHMGSEFSSALSSGIRGA